MTSVVILIAKVEQMKSANANNSDEDCGVWVTCQWIFRASRLSLRRLTETYSRQFHNVLLTSYGIYLPTSPLLRNPSVLGLLTSYCPLKTIGSFFLGHYIMPSALLWVTHRGR